MPTHKSKSSAESGYILLSVMLLLILLMLTLTIEAPRIVQQIRREREAELIHRGNEYKNAIRKYFRKFGRYPLSIDQLESSNNLRFLRKRYKDPITGKDDWRILHAGEVQLNPVNQGTAAPGQPIGQAPGSNIGNPGGLGGNQPLFPSQQSSGGGTNPAGSAGGPNGPGQTGTMGQMGQPGGLGQPAPGVGSPQANGSMGLASGDNSPTQFGGGPIIGVSSTSKKESIKLIDGKSHYNEWYFVYDPRLEVPTMQPGAPGTAGTTNPIGGNTPGQINPMGPGTGFNQPNPGTNQPSPPPQNPPNIPQ